MRPPGWISGKGFLSLASFKKPFYEQCSIYHYYINLTSVIKKYVNLRELNLVNKISIEMKNARSKSQEP